MLANAFGVYAVVRPKPIAKRLDHVVGGDANVRAFLTACPPQDGLAVARGEAFYAAFYAVIRVVRVQGTGHCREASC